MPDAAAGAFVKRGDPDELAAEAEGLRWLAQAGALRVAEVMSVGGGELVLERIEGDAPLDEEAFGRGLALLHRAGPDGFGWHHPIRFRDLVLPNDPAPDFETFYRECRVRPFDTALADRVRLEVPEEPPARCHGDLWRGNVLAGPGGEPVLIDPWAHGGHREVDLAMLDLFGGLSPRMVAAYEEVHPLADGWRERLPQWQLFPLLVHAAVFGGGYVDQVRAVTARL